MISFIRGHLYGFVREAALTPAEWKTAIAGHAALASDDCRRLYESSEAQTRASGPLSQQGDQDKPEYRALQPFGHVPILEEDGLVLFESGAIVLHIGARSATLLPSDPSARARATHRGRQRGLRLLQAVRGDH